MLSYLLGLDMKLLDRIKLLDQKSLRELDSHIHKLLGPAVTYQQKPTRCRCEKCKSGGPGHGSYWYAYFSYGGKTHCVYVGREKREINPLEELKKKQSKRKKSKRGGK